MSFEKVFKDRRLAPGDPALHPGWRLLEFLLPLGADEFSVRFAYAGEDGKDTCDRLARRLAFASLGERIRECAVTYGTEGNPRPVEVWRFDQQSLAALQGIMPTSIMGSPDTGQAWTEDLCIYREGGLLLGVVTHEQHAFLRLSDDEWTLWRQTEAAR